MEGMKPGVLRGMKMPEQERRAIVRNPESAQGVYNRINTASGSSEARKFYNNLRPDDGGLGTTVYKFVEILEEKGRLRDMKVIYKKNFPNSPYELPVVLAAARALNLISIGRE